MRNFINDFIHRAGSCCLSLFLLVSGAFLATQIIAMTLKYDPNLGDPLIGSFYQPFAFVGWVSANWSLPSIRVQLMPGLLVFMVFTIAAVGCAVRFAFNESRNRKNATTHGSAHFASLAEVKQSDLWMNTDPLSVHVGGMQVGNFLHYLRDSSPMHVFAYAPSRSGKGVGLIVPTLLTYQGSVIISDFKLENWHLTAGARRAMGQIVLKFDPTSPDETTARYNPLLEVRQGVHEVRDVQLITDMIVDPTGKGRADHWLNTGNSLLVSAILHVLYSEPDKSLAGVRNFLSHTGRNEKDTLKIMLETIHDTEKKWGWFDPNSPGKVTYTHPAVASGAREMLNKSDNERNGIFSTALTALKLFRDPIIAKNTRGHDFTIQDLVTSDKPVSLYLGIPPSDLERTMPLMRLVLNQILTRLIEKLDIQDGKSLRQQLLLMLDEFPQFGKLPFFEKALGYAGGYNIRAYLISQDIQQIYQEYGQQQTILSNCGIQIAYAPNTIETAKHISESLGITTIQKPQWSYSGDRRDLFLPKTSLSYSEVKRELMTPDELLRLDDRTALIFRNGVPPIKGNKLYYYTDKNWLEKSKLPVPISDRLKVNTVWNNMTLPPAAATTTQQESLLPDETPADVPPSNTDESVTDGSVITTGTAEHFLNWLRKKYREQAISMNEPGSILQRVDRGLLIVAKPAVAQFLRENPDNRSQTDSEAKQIERLVQKLSHASALDKPCQYYWGTWEDRKIIKGFIVPVERIVMGEIPLLNTQLQFDETYE